MYNKNVKLCSLKLRSMRCWCKDSLEDINYFVKYTSWQMQRTTRLSLQVEEIWRLCQEIKWNDCPWGTELSVGNMTTFWQSRKLVHTMKRASSLSSVDNERKMIQEYAYTRDKQIRWGNDAPMLYANVNICKSHF